ncbi:hypothetical protein FGG08_000672 [Glutinoglossum americanum]|uniref:Uncharacterized protein n=1 Tax=Glutinoglossum americanum TaxID=1670608 RepID=A0A9P8L102_9PEZI|nr:hypothetical protein FGG08_000672 [Glutinoglossum americanum]
MTTNATVNEQTNTGKQRDGSSVADNDDNNDDDDNDDNDDNDDGMTKTAMDGALPAGCGGRLTKGCADASPHYQRTSALVQVQTRSCQGVGRVACELPASCLRAARELLVRSLALSGNWVQGLSFVTSCLFSRARLFSILHAEKNPDRHALSPPSPSNPPTPIQINPQQDDTTCFSVQVLFL